MRRLAATGAKLVLTGMVQGVVGWIAVITIQGMAASPVRDAVLVLVWPLVIVAGTIVAVFWLRRPEQGARGGLVRPEWQKLDQNGHWDALRHMALDVEAQLQEVVGKKKITVGDQSNLRALVDYLHEQVGAYGESWGISSLWSEREQRRWDVQQRGSYSGPPWAVPLWERLQQARWWLARHDPVEIERLERGIY